MILICTIPQEKDTKHEPRQKQGMETSGTAKLRRASSTGWTRLEAAELTYSTELKSAQKPMYSTLTAAEVPWFIATDRTGIGAIGAIIM